jgi:iron(III) transport system permease protein
VEERGIPAGVSAAPPNEGPKRRPRFDQRQIATSVVLAVVAYLVVVPLAYLLWQTFRNGGEFGLEGFRRAYEGTGLGALVVNSIVFAVGSTIVATVVGTALAYLTTRTDLPFAGWSFLLAMVPLILPGILHTVAWIFLASPRTGFVNVLLGALPGDPTVDIFSMSGMILVEGLHSVPLAFLLMVAAFRSVDPSLEEAAMTSGAGLATILRRVTLPTIRPAFLGVVLLTLIRSLEAFEVPALLGIPARTWVFTSRIWSALRGYPLRLDEAGALSVALLTLMLIAVFGYRRLTRDRADFQTITGVAARRRPVPLGKWRVPAMALVWSYLALGVLLPIAMLGYVATQPFFSTPSLESLGNVTLDNFQRVLSGGDSLRAIRNSLLLGVGAASVVAAITAVGSWIAVRSRTRGRVAVEQLTAVPLVIPGLVMGLALLTVYLRVPAPIFGTLWILLIAYVTRYLPYGMRSATAAMHQIGDEMEESAHVAGATWWQTMRLVHVPLLLPGLAAGWIYVFLVSIRELSSSILLYSPGREVMSVVIMDQWLAGRIPELAALGVVMMVMLSVLTALAWRVGARFGIQGV